MFRLVALWFDGLQMVGTMVIGVVGLPSPFFEFVEEGVGTCEGDVDEEKWMLSGKNIHIKMCAAVIIDRDTFRKTPSIFG